MYRHDNLCSDRRARERCHGFDGINGARVQNLVAAAVPDLQREYAAILGDNKCQYHPAAPPHAAGNGRIAQPLYYQIADIGEVFLEIFLLGLLRRDPLISLVVRARYLSDL